MNYPKREALWSAISYFHRNLQQDLLLHEKCLLIVLMSENTVTIRETSSFSKTLERFCAMENMIPFLSWPELFITGLHNCQCHSDPFRLFVLKGAQVDELCFAKPKQFAFCLTQMCVGRKQHLLFSF